MAELLNDGAADIALLYAACWTLSLVAIATAASLRGVPVVARKTPRAPVRGPLRRPAVVGTFAAAVLLPACGLPFPGGEGSASPEEREPRPPEGVSASAETVANAVVDAWRTNDRRRADALTETEAENQLLKRPYPSDDPKLVNCRVAHRGAADETCLFVVDNRTFELRAIRGDDGRWTIRSVKFHAW